jgi:hypothetical protein
MKDLQNVQMLRNAKPTIDASTGASDRPMMRKADLPASLFDLPSLPQISNHGRPAVTPAPREGIAK